MHEKANFLVANNKSQTFDSKGKQKHLDGRKLFEVRRQRIWQEKMNKDVQSD